MEGPLGRRQSDVWRYLEYDVALGSLNYSVGMVKPNSRLRATSRLNLMSCLCRSPVVMHRCASRVHLVGI